MTSRAQIAPPESRVEAVEVTLHGQVVRDPYRWLEDRTSPDTQAWVAAQNAYTEAQLDGAARSARSSGQSLAEALDDGHDQRAGGARRPLLLHPARRRAESAGPLRARGPRRPGARAVDPNRPAPAAPSRSTGGIPPRTARWSGLRLLRPRRREEHPVCARRATGAAPARRDPRTRVLQPRLGAGWRRLLLHALPGARHRAGGRRGLPPARLPPPLGADPADGPRTVRRRARHDRDGRTSISRRTGAGCWCWSIRAGAQQVYVRDLHEPTAQFRR